ncbi:hypothetical protein BD289DRAFT_213905 [Coniella lustricola]|uniref:Uncharacterized protein n=1 Tax=Coniella lustricola TaxID=2025994 RepID=A0A2T2ZS54_9PEZI|nr:hypothetical protein BD289DRAFT_213905 [Coniella lustricola]
MLLGLETRMHTADSSPALVLVHQQSGKRTAHRSYRPLVRLLPLTASMRPRPGTRAHSTDMALLDQIWDTLGPGRHIQAVCMSFARSTTPPNTIVPNKREAEPPTSNLALPVRQRPSPSREICCYLEGSPARIRHWDLAGWIVIYHQLDTSGPDCTSTVSGSWSASPPRIAP